jgi:hypothetical protein
MWLWVEKDYFSFDEGCRVEGFAHFEDETQFARQAEHLAQRAADEVRRYQALYPCMLSAARHLASKSPKGFWDFFHAGVACGLVGESAQAKQFLGQVAGTSEQTDWAQAAASLAREYSLALEDLPGFRRRIEDVIHRARNLLRLEAIGDIGLD